MERVKTIGLVGGVASGKSLVARMLVDLGAGLLDADRTGHEVLADDPQVREAVRDRWGDAVLAADGTVDRRAVAERVFGTGNAADENRRFLENLLHPRIRRRLEERRKDFAIRGRPAVVLDAPLLLEAGWGPMCEILLMVDAPRAVRMERAGRRGWTEAEFARREAAQSPVDEKRRHADFLITNDCSQEDLRAAVEAFWREHVLADKGG